MFFLAKHTRDVIRKLCDVCFHLKIAFPAWVTTFTDLQRFNNKRMLIALFESNISLLSYLSTDVSTTTFTILSNRPLNARVYTDVYIRMFRLTEYISSHRKTFILSFHKCGR